MATTSCSGKALYFLRITPANFLYAWWLSLKHPVSAWKIELPDRLARRFTPLRPNDLFTFDEWLLIHDRAFDNWKQAAFPAVYRTHTCATRYTKNPVDFSRNLWQVLGIEFDRLSIVVAMACTVRGNGSDPPTVVEPWLARAFDKSQLAAIFPAVEFRSSAIHRWIEGAHEWAISCAHLARLLISVFLSFLRPRKYTGRRKVIWTGISAQEMPDGDGQLNFAWATQFGHLPSEDAIFFLPCSPSSGQRAYLSKHRVTWIAPNEAFGVLPWRRRVRVATGALAAFLEGLISKSGVTGVFLARFMCRAPYWEEVIRELGVDRYFTTTSACWPEAPETAMLKSLNVRSIIWSYSANSMRFARNASEFRDVGVLRSLLISDEIWVWNEAHCDYYRRRRVADEVALPAIKVTGTMMCGDARILNMTAGEARQRLGISETGFLVSVFDVATVDDEWRRKFEGGPVAIDLEFAEAFFSGLRALLQALPELSIILKLKRKIGSRYRAFPPALLELVSDRSDYLRNGRIWLTDVNCDPFLPIAAADAAIGMPCTSPVLTTASLGRPAAYFDPHGLVGYIQERGLRDLCIRQTQDLIELTRTWMAGTSQTIAPEINCRPVWLADSRLFGK